MILKEDLIKVGKFQKTHALKGELNMISDIDSEYFEEGNPMIVEYEGIPVPYYVESIRKKGSTSYLVKLEGVETEETASTFVNKEIMILKKDAEEWLGEEIYESDALTGYQVIDSDSKVKIGEIVDVDYSTANLLFIVENEEGDEIMVPANEDLILKIDDEAKSIIMKLPDGLINLNLKGN